jgi:hypothetical protein
LEVLNEVKTVRFVKWRCCELLFLAVAGLLFAGPAAADGYKSRQLTLPDPAWDSVPTLSARNDSLTSDLQFYLSGNQQFTPFTRSNGWDGASLLEPNSLGVSPAKPDLTLAFSLNNFEAKSSLTLDGRVSSRTAADSTPPSHHSTLSALLHSHRHQTDRSGPAPELGNEPSDFVLLGICLLLMARLLSRELPVPKASATLPSSFSLISSGTARQRVPRRRGIGTVSGSVSV